jgi:hypothetical protein
MAELQIGQLFDLPASLVFLVGILYHESESSHMYVEKESLEAAITMHTLGMVVCKIGEHEEVGFNLFRRSNIQFPPSRG